MSLFVASHKLDRAKGLMIGAALGDAIGALLEWQVGPVHDDLLEWAFTFGNFKGGGPHQIATGQITDDTEQQLCLARGLVNCGTTFDLNKIAKEYSRWRWGGCPGKPEMEPFDVGKASNNAFRSCAHLEECFLWETKEGCKWGDYCFFKHSSETDSSNVLWATTMTQAAYTHNFTIKSNGALMRSMPMAVWGHSLVSNHILTLVEFIQKEASLSHPNFTCVEANVVYILSCAYLMNNGSASSTLPIISAWMKQNSRTEDIPEWFREAVETDNVLCARFENSQWEDGGIGFVRWAFSWAFRGLKIWATKEKEGYFIKKDEKDTESETKKRDLWISLIKNVLRAGGDTDTNAAISGGMLGILCGFDNLPKNMVDTVLTCDTARNHALPGIPRPEFLRACQLEDLALELCTIAENMKIEV